MGNGKVPGDVYTYFNKRFLKNNCVLVYFKTAKHWYVGHNMADFGMLKTVLKVIDP